MERGKPPILNLTSEGRLREAVIEAIGRGIARSAHDCSEGGLAVALAECCVSSERPIGAVVDLDSTGGMGEAPLRPDALLFGESHGRVILSCEAGSAEALLNLAEEHRVPARALGTVGGSHLRIRSGGRPLVEEEVNHLAGLWKGALGRLMA